MEYFESLIFSSSPFLSLPPPLNQDGPIAVHCSGGVGRTGVFITLSIVLERMRYEGVVDLFTTCKLLRSQRPAMVQTEDQYQFSYRAALEYLGSFDHYAN